MRGVASQALGKETLPTLDKLQPAELLKIIRLLRKDAARMAAFQHASPPAREEDPF